MENRNEKLIEALNGLIMINIDRTEGYNKAAKESKYADLDSLFLDFANKSVVYASVLAKHVKSLGGTPADKPTAAGEVYRVWMDIRAALAAKDRKAVLASCEYGEDVALKSYQEVLDNKDVLNFTYEVTDILMSQQSEIKMAHNKIKTMRDTEKEKKETVK